MLQRRSVIKAMAVAAAGMPAWARPAALQIDMPRFEVGDRWSFRRTNLWTDEVVGGYELTVVSVDADRLQLSGRRLTLAGDAAGDAWAQQADLKAWPAVQPVARELLPALAYPLVEGKTWTFDYAEIDAATGERAPCHVEGAVEDGQTVTVPAGTFRCVKVVQKQRRMIHRADGIFPANDLETTWYAQETKAHVKRQFRRWNRKGELEGQSAFELVSYRVM